MSAGEHVTCTFTNKKRGQIVVVQDSQPNDAQDFGFTAAGGLSPTSFSLDDDADGTLSNTRTFTNVVSRNGYSLSQATPAGWGPGSGTCNDNSPITNIDVNPNETVTCTFVSQKQGSVTIVKDAVPNDAQDFGFTVGGGLSPSSFNLDDDSDGALSNTRAFTNVNPGTYSASETVPPGWNQTGATCSDGSPVTASPWVLPRTSPAPSPTRRPGRSSLLRTRNRTTRRTSPSSRLRAWAPSISRSMTTPTARCPTRGPSRTCRSAAGHSVSQALPSGWDLLSSMCSDGSIVTNINISAGEIVTCTWTNQKRGSITVVKNAVPDDAQDFAFTAGGGLSPTSFSLDDDANATLSNSRVFSNVSAGSGYSVAEAVPSGWDQTSAICSDGSPVTNIDISWART